jgi:hypothetical protein
VRAAQLLGQRAMVGQIVQGAPGHLPDRREHALRRLHPRAGAAHRFEAGLELHAVQHVLPAGRHERLPVGDEVQTVRRAISP